MSNSKPAKSEKVRRAGSRLRGPARLHSAPSGDHRASAGAGPAARRNTPVAAVQHVAHTGLREALLKSAAEGFRDNPPQPQHHRIDDQFRRVAGLLRHAHPDVSTRRHGLRRCTGRTPIWRSSAGVRRIFDAAVEAADALAMIASNRELHVAIARAGRNKYYVELFARLLDEGRRLLRIYYRTFQDHRRVSMSSSTPR